MSNEIFIVNDGIGSGGSGGGAVDPSTLGGKFLGYIDNNTASFPANPNTSDYVLVNPSINNSDLPFTIENITFFNKNDSAIFSSGRWTSNPVRQNTQSVSVVDSASESLSGTATNQQEINKENREKFLDIETNAHKTTGYFSSTAPSNADKGNLWFQTNANDDEGSDLPTTFPIQVKIYENGSWSSITQNYTVKSGDIWANLNNHHEYYWMAGSWNWTDATKPNLNPNQLKYNEANQVTIKDNAIDANLLTTDITDNSTLTQDNSTNKILIKDSGIVNAKIANNTIEGIKLNANVVDNDSLQYDEINNYAKIKANGVKTSHIDDLQITTNKIADNAITKDKINNDIVDNVTIEKDSTSKQIQVKENSLNDDYIQDNSVSLSKLKNVKTSSDNVSDYDNASDNSPISEKFLQKTLKNVFTPQNDSDAANKLYVDENIFDKMHFLGFMSSSDPVSSGYDWTNLIWFNSSLNVGPVTKTFNATKKNGDGTTNTVSITPKIGDIIYNINSKTFFIYNGGNFTDNQLWDILSCKYTSSTIKGLKIDPTTQMRYVIDSVMFAGFTRETIPGSPTTISMWLCPDVLCKENGKLYYDANPSTGRDIDYSADVKELVEIDTPQTLKNKDIVLKSSTTNGTYLRVSPSTNYVTINTLRVTQVGTNLYHFDILFNYINNPYGIVMFSIKTAKGNGPDRPFVVNVASWEKATGGVGVVYEGSGNCYCYINFSSADGKIVVSGDFPVD